MIKNDGLINGIPISTELIPEIEDEEAPGRPDKKRFLFISLLAILIAAGVGFIAKLLIYLINLITNLAFYLRFSVQDVSPANNTLGWWAIVIPVIGGLIVGLMALYGSKAIRGHGIPEAMEQILANQSKISPILTYLKPLSSAISIGTGGPFGAEGPIIATGGALGSTIGQVLKISHHERKILLAAGAAAGMSAIFDSPVAAIFLAIELLLFEFSPTSVIPVALASITGAAGHHLLFDTGNIFQAPFIETPCNEALALYSVMGLLLGVVATLITKSAYFVEDSFGKLPIHWFWWPAMGGVVVGLIGVFAPRTLGVGYDNIKDILSGALPVKVIIFLCVMKFLSWAVALGSGTSGGTLAPLLTIGGATGVLMGIFIQFLFPQAGIVLPLAGLVGMSATFAGASRALLTSIIFALETTGQLHALLPLLSSCTASYVVSYFLMENTIMTEKIARRGINAPNALVPDVLAKFTIAQVISAGGFTINGDNTIKEVKAWLSNHENSLRSHFIIVNEEGAYLGIISFYELYGAAQNENLPVKSLIKKNYVAVAGSSSLRKAIEIMTRENLEVLPVTLNGNSDKIIGVLSYKNIISAYKRHINEHLEPAHQISLKRRGIKILVKGQRLMNKFGMIDR